MLSGHLDDIYETNPGKDALLDAYRQIIADNGIENCGEKLAFKAAEYVHPEALSFLFEAGVDPKISDGRNGRTLLHYAAIRNPYRRKYIAPEDDTARTVKLLLEKKVNVLAVDNWENKVCYLHAAEHGAWRFVRALAEAGVRLSRTDKNGNTGIHTACNYVERAIQSLSRIEASLGIAAGKPKESNEIPAKLKAFAEAGVDMAQKNSEGKTALDLIAGANAVPAWMLSESYREDKLKERDETLEKIEDYYKTVKAFADAGVDLDEKNAEGRTAQYLAIRSGAKKISVFLAGTPGTDADGGNETAQLRLAAGGMDLFTAVIQGDYDAIAALVKLGTPVDALSPDDGPFPGMTALGIACARLEGDAAELLLDYGANPNYRDAEGRAAICYCFSMYVNQSQSNPEIEGAQIARVMLSHSFDLNGFVNDDSDTVLNLACKTEYGFTIKTIMSRCFLDAGADVNISNRAGVTPLMHASGKDFANLGDIQLLLLEKGADTAAQDNYGNTALHYAAGNNSMAGARTLAENLIDYGADAKTVNNEDKTALDIAVERNNEALAKILLKAM